MDVTQIAFQLDDQFGREATREALRLYDETWRADGKAAAAPYVTVAIILCRNAIAGKPEALF